MLNKDRLIKSDKTNAEGNKLPETTIVLTPVFITVVIGYSYKRN